MIEEKKKSQILLDLLTLDKGQKIEEAVLCLNCKGILINQKTCKNCENFFCEECSQELLEKPVCINSKKHQFIKPHKIMEKILSKYKFNCENRKNGCINIITYKNVQNHHSNCLYKKINCKNEFCDSILLLKDIEDHDKNCQYKQTKCKFCLNIFLLCDLNLHHSHCEKKPVKCNGCNLEMFQIEFSKHIKNCLHISENCKTCKKKMKRKEFKFHTKESCIFEIFINFKKATEEALDDYKVLASHLQNRLKQREEFMGDYCVSCNNYACEVSKKKCVTCMKNYCIPCSRKSLRNCRQCHSFGCVECFEGSYFCGGCCGKKMEEIKVLMYENEIGG